VLFLNIIPSLTNAYFEEGNGVLKSIISGTTQPYDGQVDPQFFRDADAALYAAKAQGRNRVVWQTTAG
jgi:PleD family two-component response regulator